MEVEEKLGMFATMQRQMAEMEERIQKTDLIAQQVQEFYDQGILKNNESGVIQVVQNSNEREHIKEQISSKKKGDRRHTHVLDQQSHQS